MLHEFLSANHMEIIARTRAKVATRSAPRATEAEPAHGVPLFLDQLVAVLRRESNTADASRPAAAKFGYETCPARAASSRSICRATKPSRDAGSWRDRHLHDT